MNLAKNREAIRNLPKPKAIIFDWDNTLVDTWPLIQNAIDETMVAMGLQPWGLEKVRDNVHKSMRESFPEIFGSDWQKAGEIYKNAYRSTHLEKIQLLPNALQLINQLKKSKILQFVVSNKIGVTLRKEVLKLGVEKEFFSLVGAGDASFDKPSKDPIDLALMGSGLNPQKDEIWLVGDTIADVECAYNSSCRAIVFGDEKGRVSKTIAPEILEKGFKESGVLPVYFDHAELAKLISA